MECGTMSLDAVGSGKTFNTGESGSLDIPSGLFDSASEISCFSLQFVANSKDLNPGEESAKRQESSRRTTFSSVYSLNISPGDFSDLPSDFEMTFELNGESLPEG
mgnify:CR=1 FL=1